MNFLGKMPFHGWKDSQFYFVFQKWLLICGCNKNGYSQSTLNVFCKYAAKPKDTKLDIEVTSMTWNIELKSQEAGNGKHRKCWDGDAGQRGWDMVLSYIQHLKWYQWTSKMYKKRLMMTGITYSLTHRLCTMSYII